MSYDPYDPSYRYSTDPLDDPTRGLDGLGGYGAGYNANDDLALAGYNSGLDGLGAAGLASYDGAGGLYDDGLSGGLGGLSLDTGLDGLGGGLHGLAEGGYDSGYGGLGSGLSGDFGIPEIDGNLLGKLFFATCPSNDLAVVQHAFGT